MRDSRLGTKGGCGRERSHREDLSARPQIIESTFDRVRYGFTTIFPYHILWW